MHANDVTEMLMFVYYIGQLVVFKREFSFCFLVGQQN